MPSKKEFPWTIFDRFVLQNGFGSRMTFQNKPSGSLSPRGLSFFGHFNKFTVTVWPWPWSIQETLWSWRPCSHWLDSGGKKNQIASPLVPANLFWKASNGWKAIHKMGTDWILGLVVKEFYYSLFIIKQNFVIIYCFRTRDCKIPCKTFSSNCCLINSWFLPWT